MAKTFDQLVQRTTSKTTRDRAARRSRQLMAQLLLSEIRKLAGKSQRELADALGIKQPSLSKLESQSDIQVSTLRKLIEALGGQLRLVADFPGKTVQIGQFESALRAALPKNRHIKAA